MIFYFLVLFLFLCFFFTLLLFYSTLGVFSNFCRLLVSLFKHIIIFHNYISSRLNSSGCHCLKFNHYSSDHHTTSETFLLLHVTGFGHWPVTLSGLVLWGWILLFWHREHTVAQCLGLLPHSKNCVQFHHQAGMYGVCMLSQRHTVSLVFMIEL